MRESLTSARGRVNFYFPYVEKAKRTDTRQLGFGFVPRIHPSLVPNPGILGISLSNESHVPMLHFRFPYIAE